MILIDVGWQPDKTAGSAVEARWRLHRVTPFRLTIVFDFSSLPPTSYPDSLDNGHATRKNVGACLGNNARTMSRNDFGSLSLSLCPSFAKAQIGTANQRERCRLDANLFRKGTTTLDQHGLISNSCRVFSGNAMSWFLSMT